MASRVGELDVVDPGVDAVDAKGRRAHNAGGVSQHDLNKGAEFGEITG
jgi:hypothetical protein